MSQDYRIQFAVEGGRCDRSVASPRQRPRHRARQIGDAATLPAGHVEGFADTFAALFRAVYADAASGGMSERPVYATFADGHEEMLVGDAVLESAREGRWVDVPRGSRKTANTLEDVHR